MSEAKDNKNADLLVAKMLEPPFDQEAPVDPKPGSYERFVELAEDLKESGQVDAAKWAEHSFDLWESAGKKRERS